MPSIKNDPEVRRLCPPGTTWSFQHGLLVYEGQPDEPERILEAVSSNGLTVYTAILWKRSGLASCNCPGWTIDKGGIRYCKHIQQLARATESVFYDSTEIRRNCQPPVAAAVEKLRGLTFID